MNALPLQASSMDSPFTRARKLLFRRGRCMLLALMALAATSGSGEEAFDFGDAPDGINAPRYPTLLVHNGEVEDHGLWIKTEELEPSPAKWIQPPDLTPNGFDVECMRERPILLADDFLCTNRTAITNIVIWGSWTNDILPLAETGRNPGNVTFTLSIHTDRPKGTEWPWSIPGPVVWWTNFPPGSFTVRTDSPENLVEGWYDPVTSNWTPNADWTCYRYDFPVDIIRAFVQTGTVEHPVVYWLDVQALPHDQSKEARFGWKTTHPAYRWNDDACWSPNLEPYNGIQWFDMHYPPGHPYHQLSDNSFDLAFALFGAPVAEEQWDYGDAPDGLQGGPGPGGFFTYPTLLANNGARHAIDPTLFLGGVIDAEINGQPTVLADGDDVNPPAALNDEDGVIFTSLLYAGLPASIQVTASGAGYLSAWLDINNDCDWSDGGEQMLADFWLYGGTTNLSFTVPPIPPAVAGVTYMRFRFSTLKNLTETGPAPDGEVEDYQVTIRQLSEHDDIDFSDADLPFPTLRVNNGAGHVIAGIRMGAAIDRENDGLPTPLADGDDRNSPFNDEDGVAFPTDASGTNCLVRGSNMTVTVTVNGIGFLNAWVDFTGDRDWNDAGEQICAGLPVAAGPNAIPVTAPAQSMVGYAFARFRYSSVAALGYTGLAPDGEVEDYRVLIYQPRPTSPTNIVFTNLVYAVTNGARMHWDAQADLLTYLQYCTNLVIAATNAGSWNPLGGTSTNRQYTDNDATNRTPSFYRVVAPLVWP